MTLRELLMTVSTSNYCHYTIRCLHMGTVYADVTIDNIAEKYKDMGVYSAVPVMCSCGAVKEWHICVRKNAL